ncbi:hypothetical protein VNO78_09984 [Psophocarpus tetragonolobus]|uniref:DYW domain-containing protein n=1 Tax=Psophocarpus tetragonolobus TaxID=3891 RepID=A0AAN9SLG0_PSOTE
MYNLRQLHSSYFLVERPTNYSKPELKDPHIVKCTKAISIHMRNGHCDLALHIFNAMPLRNSVSYNAMLSGYLRNAKFSLARNLFDRMPHKDLFSWNLMLTGCLRNHRFLDARMLFDSMPKKDIVSWNAMLSGYVRSGHINEAREVFDKMPHKNSISWNGLLAAYVRSGRLQEALCLFKSKSDWELISWNCLIGGYVKRNMLGDARQLFDQMPVRDLISWNTMISGYAQDGDLSQARRLFEESPVRDVFTWTAMVCAYVHDGMLDEARRVFDEMPQKREMSYNAMILGYAQYKRMDMARELFEATPFPNIVSWNVIISGYCQKGDVAQARNLFNRMPRRDSVSWAAIIAGYAQNSHYEEAMNMLVKMKRDGQSLNRCTFCCALSTCADIPALELGKQVHGQVVKTGYENGCLVGNALVGMYCKCGCIDEAYDVFQRIQHKDIVSWNTMLTGYARHGFGRQALTLFESMITAAVKPDEITMVGVLSACSHTGLTDRGTEYFHSMNKAYGITPNSKHYTCMVDLLGRAGRLEEAEILIKSMPFEADAATWGALLGASRIHGNMELGEKAAEVVFKMEPSNSGTYVLLSKLYAVSGRWADFCKMRLRMREVGVQKIPGHSWVEVHNKIHTFTVGDCIHPEKDRIYAFLEELDLKMKHEGYVSSTNLVLHDVGEEEKKHMLKYHSEKLAVAFGILTIPAGRPIRVMKNLRVCEDCHNAIKHISKILRRFIIVRDSRRFHHFSEGICSCGDYWSKGGSRSSVKVKVKVKEPDPDIVTWNKAISIHMRNGHCDSALRVFNSMPRRSSVSFNAMISGYLRNGKFSFARDLFDRMPERDLFSWNVMLTGYVRNRRLGDARNLFDLMPLKDVVSWNAMLSGYAQNGFVDEAREVFNRMPYRNSISWNGLLAAYVHNGRLLEARHLFDSQSDWELISWNCLVGGYVKRNMLDDARRLFDQMPVRDVISWNTMISGYAQVGDLSQAKKLFDESPIQDVFTWTAMLSGYVQNGMVDEARKYFDEMPVKNEISYNAMLAGYVQYKKMDIAWKLFEAMPCRNISSWNTMITGYGQNGGIAQARKLFDMMPQRDCVSWAAIIAGYAQNSHYEEALNMFVEMKRDGEISNRSTFSCALSTCADIAALDLGKQVHGQVVKAGFETGCFVGNALLGMYFKCGSTDEANDVFEGIEKKDVVSWNTMIAGYARHGFGRQALVLFESMKKAGVKPDEITMVGVLSACSHSGLIDKGTEYFYSMTGDYNVTPTSKHYTCMVDLLGRAGRLEEAENLMRNMPFEPGAASWGALLGASRIHGNTELGEKAAEMVFKMEPHNSGMYVLLSNLYAASGRWVDVGKMRSKMKEVGVQKVTGYSWVEVQNKIHTFAVGDCFHPEKDRIYAFLEELDLKMRREGYVSSTKLVLHDVEEEEKEHMLKYHSEKLAVAFGILTISAGRPIRVMKNLRVCQDCHNAIKHISKIVGRLIILRDSHRFHHFNEGICSCGDYW